MPNMLISIASQQLAVLHHYLCATRPVVPNLFLDFPKMLVNPNFFSVNKRKKALHKKYWTKM